MNTSDDLINSVASGLRWFKSRHSNPSGNCVEVAKLDLGGIAVRNSRRPDGAVLVFTSNQFAELVHATKRRRFDDQPA